MDIATRLKDTRLDHDHTQKQTADAIGCSSKQIIRYESGDQEMTLSKLKAFCLYYHVSADYILGLPKGMNWPR